jgi:hypothetical protein
MAHKEKPTRVAPVGLVFRRHTREAAAWEAAPGICTEDILISAAKGQQPVPHTSASLKLIVVPSADLLDGDAVLTDWFDLKLFNGCCDSFLFRGGADGRQMLRSLPNDINAPACHCSPAHCPINQAHSNDQYGGEHDSNSQILKDIFAPLGLGRLPVHRHCFRVRLSPIGCSFQLTVLRGLEEQGGGHGVIQRERRNSRRRFACATYKSDFPWQPSFFRWWRAPPRVPP